MLDKGATITADTEQARRAIEGGKMARKRFQRGSLFQRGKRQRVWVARWWEDVIQPNGMPGRIRRAEVMGTLADLPTRRKAMQVLSERLRPVNGGTLKPQSTLSLGQFVRENWEPVLLPTLKYATQKHYQYTLRVHILPAFGIVQLREITREAIQAFLISKLQGGLSWQTVHHLRCALSKVLGTAEEWGYIAENPTRKTRLPRRKDKYERPIITPEQIRLLVPNLSEPARSVVLLLLTTGFRVGELLALRWRDVDLEVGVLRVRETVYDGHFDEPKTKKSHRVIPIGPQTVGILEALRPLEANLDALIFTNRKNNVLDQKNLLTRDLKPVCMKLGLPNVSWHTFRHCSASMLDAVGAPLGTVQAMLGHATPEITRTVYLHAIPSDQRQAVDGLEKLIFGPN